MAKIGKKSISFLFISLGIVTLLFSVYRQNVYSAYIGLGVIFWGLILSFIVTDSPSISTEPPLDLDDLPICQQSTAQQSSVNTSTLEMNRNTLEPTPGIQIIVPPIEDYLTNSGIQEEIRKNQRTIESLDQTIEILSKEIQTETHESFFRETIDSKTPTLKEVFEDEEGLIDYDDEYTVKRRTTEAFEHKIEMPKEILAETQTSIKEKGTHNKPTLKELFEEQEKDDYSIDFSNSSSGKLEEALATLEQARLAAIEHAKELATEYTRSYREELTDFRLLNYLDEVTVCPIRRFDPQDCNSCDAINCKDRLVGKGSIS